MRIGAITEYTMEKAILVKDVINVFDIRNLCNSNLDKFYVDTSAARSDDNVVERLALMLNNSVRDDLQILFMGHNGCGKSTELYKMHNRLQNNFLIAHFSIGDYVDFAGVSYIDILFSMLHNLLSVAIKSHIAVDETILKNIYYYWRDEHIVSFSSEESSQLNVAGGIAKAFFEILPIKIAGFLQAEHTIKSETHRRISPSISTLLKYMNDFLHDIKTKLQYKKILLIIDDLDKLGLSEARSIFIENCRTLTSLKVNTIFTFPIYLCYFPEFRYIENNFDESVLLSMIKIKNRDGSVYKNGIKTIEDIVYKRADKNLFEKGVVDFAIEKSGGCIRTVLKLIKESAFNAELSYLADTNISEQNKIISKKDIHTAYKVYKSAMERSVHKNHIPLLVEINETKRPVLDSDNIIVMELLMSLAVIEYNGERWCDLNPAVKDYLIDLNIIKGESET